MGQDNKDRRYIFHNLFLRGHPHFAEKISVVDEKKTLINVKNEPDFTKLKPLP